MKTVSTFTLFAALAVAHPLGPLYPTPFAADFARDLNANFELLTRRDLCVEGARACVEGSIASCKDGAWSMTACPRATRCFAVEDGENAALQCLPPVLAPRVDLSLKERHNGEDHENEESYPEESCKDDGTTPTPTPNQGGDGQDEGSPVSFPNSPGAQSSASTPAPTETVKSQTANGGEPTTTSPGPSSSLTVVPTDTTLREPILTGIRTPILSTGSSTSTVTDSGAAEPTIAPESTIAPGADATVTTISSDSTTTTLVPEQTTVSNVETVTVTVIVVQPPSPTEDSPLPASTSSGTEASTTVSPPVITSIPITPGTTTLTPEEASVILESLSSIGILTDGTADLPATTVSAPSTETVTTSAEPASTGVPATGDGEIVVVSGPGETQDDGGIINVALPAAGENTSSGAPSPTPSPATPVSSPSAGGYSYPFGGYGARV